MKKIMYSVIFSSMLSGSAFAADPELKCYENKEFMQILDDNNAVTLYNGVIGDKVHEVMMTKDRHMYVIEYDKTSDGANRAKQYCVKTVVNDVIFNDKALEYLSNLLEKYKGQKT